MAEQNYRMRFKHIKDKYGCHSPEHNAIELKPLEERTNSITRIGRSKVYSYLTETDSTNSHLPLYHRKHISPKSGQIKENPEPFAKISKLDAQISQKELWMRQNSMELLPKKKLDQLYRIPPRKEENHFEERHFEKMRVNSVARISNTNWKMEDLDRLQEKIKLCLARK